MADPIHVQIPPGNCTSYKGIQWHKHLAGQTWAHQITIRFRIFRFVFMVQYSIQQPKPFPRSICLLSHDHRQAGFNSLPKIFQNVVQMNGFDNNY